MSRRRVGRVPAIAMHAGALGVLVMAGLSCGCVTLTPQGAAVTVYRDPGGALPTSQELPGGCSLLGSKGPVSMTEREIEGQSDPFDRWRNDAGAAGGNALLVRSRLVYSRRELNCPAASPITDCPGASGAWYDVTFESYACPSS